MDIFNQLQPKCPNCGSKLRREENIHPTEGGTIGWPTGSSWSSATYYTEPKDLGWYLFCPNSKCGFSDFKPFIPDTNFDSNSDQ